MQFFDLGSVRTKLGAKSKYNKLAAAIRDYTALHSAQVDLEKAFACLGYASGLIENSLEQSGEQKVHDDVTATIGSSLIQHAIILYARATTTTSNHRKLPMVTGQLSAELQAAHERIEKLRDDAIAHFGPGANDPSQAWAREAAVLVLTEDNMSGFRFCFERANWRAEVANLLAQLIQATRSKIDEILPGTQDQIHAELDRAMNRDPDYIGRFLHEHRFDPHEFFRDPAAAEQFLRDVQGGKGGPPETTHRHH